MRHSPGVRSSSTAFFGDPSSVGLLAKVSELCLEKRWRQEKRSRCIKRTRDDGDSSPASPMKREFLALPCHEMATAFRSRVSVNGRSCLPQVCSRSDIFWRSVARTMRLATQAGELCIAVLTERVSWSTPAFIDEPSEQSGTANHRRLSRRVAVTSHN